MAINGYQTFTVVTLISSFLLDNRRIYHSLIDIYIIHISTHFNIKMLLLIDTGMLPGFYLIIIQNLIYQRKWVHFWTRISFPGLILKYLLKICFKADNFIHTLLHHRSYHNVCYHVLHKAFPILLYLPYRSYRRKLFFRKF